MFLKLVRVPPIQRPATYGTPNGDLAAFNFDGSVAWSKHLAVPKNPYGHATSLLTWQDRVIVQFDQGEADGAADLLARVDHA